MIDRSKPTVKLSVVLEAIEMASDSSTAYYDLETNGIVWYMDPVVFGEDEENEALGELIEEGWELSRNGMSIRKKLRKDLQLNGVKTMDSIMRNENS